MPDDLSAHFENHIPAAVRRASARADEIARDAGIINVPELAPATGADAPPAQSELPLIAEAAPTNTTTVVEQQPPAAEPDDDWRQRYLTLQGKYDGEVPRLTGQVRNLEQQITNLQGLLAQLNTREPAAPATAAPAARTPAQIPQEDIESYGEDLVTAARRWARAEFADEMTQLRSQVQELSGRSQQTEVNLAQQSVAQALDGAVPNWRQVNDDAGFLEWLGHIDPFSGRKRHDMLGEAYVRGDAPRTIAFFRAYINEHTAVNQTAGSQPAHTPDPGAGRVPLESLAAPGRGSASASTGAPAEKRVWSNQDIAAFYRNVQRGQYNGREAERLRLEQDIFAAVSEGRVR